MALQQILISPICPPHPTTLCRFGWTRTVTPYGRQGPHESTGGALNAEAAAAFICFGYSLKQPDFAILADNLNILNVCDVGIAKTYLQLLDGVQLWRKRCAGATRLVIVVKYKRIDKHNTFLCRAKSAR